MGFPSADNPEPVGSRHDPCECACPALLHLSDARQVVNLGTVFENGLGQWAVSGRALSQFVHSQSLPAVQRTFGPAGRARKQADTRAGLSPCPDGPLPCGRGSDWFSRSL